MLQDVPQNILLKVEAEAGRPRLAERNCTVKTVYNCAL
jgi:hypothetical protein